MQVSCVEAPARPAGATGDGDERTLAPYKRKVLLYAPNLVGYCRAAAFAYAAYIAARAPLAAYCLWVASFALDFVDGLLARRLGQVSAFGAFLDVLLDVLGRGYLWISCNAPHPLGFCMVVLEMLTLGATQPGQDATWKESAFSSAPSWAQAVMANGFRQPAGYLAVYGLYGAPLWLFAHRYLPGSVLASPLLGWPALVGRLLAAAVELWVCTAYVASLLERDAASLAAQERQQG